MSVAGFFVQIACVGDVSTGTKARTRKWNTKMHCAAWIAMHKIIKNKAISRATRPQFLLHHRLELKLCDRLAHTQRQTISKFELDPSLGNNNRAASQDLVNTGPGNSQ